MSNDSSKPAEDSKLPVVPWNPWWGVLVVIIVYFASQLLSAIAISFHPVISNLSGQEAADWLAGSTGAQFLYILITEALALGALYLFLKRYDLNFSAIGLRRPRWSDVGWGLTAVPVYFLLLIITVMAVSQFVPGVDVNQEQEIGFENVAGFLPLLMTFIGLVILPPFAEEIMTRGFLYSSLKKGLPIAAAVIITSLLFAAAHLPAGGEAGPLYIAAIDTFVLSLILIYLREMTGGLWAPITLHAIKNGIAFTALFIIGTR